MSSVMRLHTRTTLILAILCVVLLTVAVAEWRFPVAANEADPPDTGGSQAAVPQAGAAQASGRINIPPLAHFSELVERPLFRQDRRPFVAEARPAPKRNPGVLASQLKLVLTGVIMTPSGETAVVKDLVTHKTNHVKVGQTIKGWTLDKLESDKIVLKKGASTHEIILRDPARRPKAPPPQPPVNQAAQAAKNQAKNRAKNQAKNNKRK
jgi:hypothetical protein